MDRETVKYFGKWLWRKKEAFIWLAALAWLAFDNPAGHHYSLCPLHNLGFSFCPGCGLGRSIGYLFRLDFEASLRSHPLGIPAVALLVTRVIVLFSGKRILSISI
jgi:hypothetical protein